MCYTTKTNCSDRDELCYVGTGKAGKSDSKVQCFGVSPFFLFFFFSPPSTFVTRQSFPFGFSASVLDIKVKGCLPMEKCNKTTVVEFLANKTLYTLETTCCEEDLCNAGPSIQLSLVPLLLTVLLIADMF